MTGRLENKLKTENKILKEEETKDKKNLILLNQEIATLKDSLEKASKKEDKYKDTKSYEMKKKTFIFR